jgi:hypothetical protein
MIIALVFLFSKKLSIEFNLAASQPKLDGELARHSLPAIGGKYIAESVRIFGGVGRLVFLQLAIKKKEQEKKKIQYRICNGFRIQRLARLTIV